MRTRGTIAAIATMTIAGSGIAMANDTVPPPPHPGPGTPAEAVLGPLVAGETSFVEGTQVWTDYVYDDLGADSDGVPGGDEQYADALEHGNAADLVQVQLRATDDGLHMTVLLSTLLPDDVDEVALQLLVDGDLDRSTGGIDGPHRMLSGSAQSRHEAAGERITVGGLVFGSDLAVTVTGGIAQVWEPLRLPERWQVREETPVVIDPDRNTISFEVPLPEDVTTPRLALGAGTYVGGGRLPTEVPFVTFGPSATFHDLAFVHGADPYTETAWAVPDAGFQVSGQVTRGEGTTREWQDHEQAELLAGRGDVDDLSVVVDLEALPGRHEPFDPRSQPGFHTLLYASLADLGEGIQREPSKVFAGPFQPYGVLVPHGLNDTERPALMFLHGADQNHLQTFNYFNHSTTEAVSPGHFTFPGFVLFPLGRVPAWTDGLAELDVLEVRADALARLPIDDDRMVVSGISSGGMGSFRYATRHPDVWSGAYSIVGHGNSVPLENLRNLPVRMHNGMADPLVHPVSVQPTIDRLWALGDVDFMAFTVNERSHVPNPALGDCLLDQFASIDRVTRPAVVTYTTGNTAGVLHPVVHGVARAIDGTAVGLGHDGAHWLSGLEAAPGAGAATAHVETHGLLERRASALTDPVLRENVTGRDFCGPDERTRTGDTWIEQGRAIDRVTTTRPVNALSADLDDLVDATLDLAGMALSSTDLEVFVASNTSGVLRLVGDWPETVEIVTAYGTTTVPRRHDGQIWLEYDRCLVAVVAPTAGTPAPPGCSVVQP